MYTKLIAIAGNSVTASAHAKIIFFDILQLVFMRRLYRSEPVWRAEA